MEWEGKETPEKNMPRATSSWPPAFPRSSPWLCCVGHIATNVSNGGALEQPCPEESVRLLIAAPSWDHAAPPSLILKYQARGGDPVSAGKMTAEPVRAQGGDNIFPFPKECKGFSKASGIKVWASSPLSVVSRWGGRMQEAGELPKKRQ